MEQMRLRLTGETGSGSCALRLERNILLFRLTVEGPAGGSLELVAQGRSPALELRWTLDRCPAFDGLWQSEGRAQIDVSPGWLWLFRDGQLWLDAPFPGVLTPRSDAFALLTAQNALPEPYLPLPRLSSGGAGLWLCQQYRLAEGDPETVPSPDAVYLAGASRGYWLIQENTT